jgi:heme oxygenase
MWREFQQVLEAHDPGPQGRAQACASAQATFDGLSATFAAVLHGTVAA